VHFISGLKEGGGGEGGGANEARLELQLAIEKAAKKLLLKELDELRTNLDRVEVVAAKKVKLKHGRAATSRQANNIKRPEPANPPPSTSSPPAPPFSSL